VSFFGKNKAGDFLNLTQMKKVGHLRPIYRLPITLFAKEKCDIASVSTHGVDLAARSKQKIILLLSLKYLSVFDFLNNLTIRYMQKIRGMKKLKYILRLHYVINYMIFIFL
jgi:hypothetical protein